MQTNYEKNLGVIEKLYQEKQDMQRRLQQLEVQLGSKAENVEGSHSMKDLEDALELTKNAIVREQREAAISKAKLTASEAAEIFDKNEAPLRPKSAQNGSPKSAYKKRLSSAEDADIDRYNQKQLMLRQREKQVALEQQQYEQKQRERMLRASRGSVEGFEELLKRQKEAQEKSHAKFLEKKALLDREKAEKAAEIKKKHLDHINKTPPIHGPSWKEIEEIEEVKRKERVEKRKNELAQQVSTIQVLERPRSSRRENRANDDEHKTFKAQDPQKVAAILARRQKQWEDQIIQTKVVLKQR